MIGGFRTDNELLAHRASAFAGLTERAGRIAGDLRNGVESHGRCWGDDEVGRAFAAGHVEPADATLQRISELPDGLADVGERLRATAITYAESDQHGEAAVQSVDG